MGRRLSLSLVWHATVFQAEIYALLACANEIKSHGRPEKHIFSLIALEAPRVVTGLLTRHNTPRTHLHLMRLSDSPLCRCGAEDETLAHVFCECEALASLKHTYLGSFFLVPQYIKEVSLGAIWNLAR
jgi:hypothetical protein